MHTLLRTKKYIAAEYAHTGLLKTFHTTWQSERVTRTPLEATKSCDKHDRQCLHEQELSRLRRAIWVHSSGTYVTFVLRSKSHGLLL